jgi:hypothetical protein
VARTKINLLASELSNISRERIVVRRCSTTGGKVERNGCPVRVASAPTAGWKQHDFQGTLGNVS